MDCSFTKLLSAHRVTTATDAYRVSCSFRTLYYRGYFPG